MKLCTSLSDSAKEGQTDNKGQEPLIPDQKELRQLNDGENNRRDGKYIVFTLPDTKNDKKWFLHNCVKGRQKQIPIGFCTSFIGLCLGVGQCKCTIIKFNSRARKFIYCLSNESELMFMVFPFWSPFVGVSIHFEVFKFLL